MTEWGSAWRQTDVQDTDLASVIIDLLEGQYRASCGEHCADQDRKLPEFLQRFIERYGLPSWAAREQQLLDRLQEGRPADRAGGGRSGYGR